jgi:hypothetical protein
MSDLNMPGGDDGIGGDEPLPEQEQVPPDDGPLGDPPASDPGLGRTPMPPD